MGRANTPCSAHVRDPPFRIVVTSETWSQSLCSIRVVVARAPGQPPPLPPSRSSPLSHNAVMVGPVTAAQLQGVHARGLPSRCGIQGAPNRPLWLPQFACCLAHPFHRERGPTITHPPPPTATHRHPGCRMQPQSSPSAECPDEQKGGQGGEDGAPAELLREEEKGGAAWAPKEAVAKRVLVQKGCVVSNLLSRPFFSRRYRTCDLLIRSQARYHCARENIR